MFPGCTDSIELFFFHTEMTERSIRRSLTRSVFQSIVVALVLSKLDFGNATLAGLPLYQLRGGLVVTRLPAAREDRGSRRAAGKSLCFHENHCDTQLWARAAH